MSPRHLAVAFGFLTRLPVPQFDDVTDEDLAQATAWFPLVGLVVGGLAGLARWLLDAPLGALPASVVAVAASMALTGAFHEDGWADMFDGLWGGWTPERRIEIMRDSVIGVYGGSALLLALTLEITLLASLASSRAGVVLVVAHVVGRACILVQIRLLPPVSDQGNGAKVAEPIGPLALSVSLVTAGAVAFAAMGLVAAIVLAASLATTIVVAAIARHKIGGGTGDILGATVMASILATLTTAVVLTRTSTW